VVPAPAKGILAVNDRLCEMLGYERDEPRRIAASIGIGVGNRQNRRRSRRGGRRDRAIAIRRAIIIAHRAPII
jgi:PAS domain-containing protein